MEHFPGRGLSVCAPPVDSSLTRGFRADGIPFQSYCGVSASSAPANGDTDVAYSHLCVMSCVFMCVAHPACLCASRVFLGSRSCLRVLAMTSTSGGRGGLYSMQITLPVLQQLLLCVGPSVSC